MCHIRWTADEGGPPGRTGKIRVDQMNVVVLQMSIPAQIRPLILCYHLYKEQVDGFVREITSAKQSYKHFLWHEFTRERTWRAAERNMRPRALSVSVSSFSAAVVNATVCPRRFARICASERLVLRVHSNLRICACVRVCESDSHAPGCEFLMRPTLSDSVS